ncbi:MAG: tetratricopeptide repeat protein [Paracoccaceae bacterium]
MSETDSFIDEVTEEVRRDRLYAMFRKYGWIGVAAVVLIVGGAAWNEWSKARAEARAQAFGDAVAAALANNDPAARTAALSAIEASSGAGHGAILALLTASQAEASGDVPKALAALKSVADDTSLSPTYRQLAQLKSVMLGGEGMAPADRDALLAELAAPGAPYRTLAMEQQALVLIDAGKTDEAVKILTALRDDAEASGGQQARAIQLLTVLGQPQAATN